MTATSVLQVERKETMARFRPEVDLGDCPSVLIMDSCRRDHWSPHAYAWVEEVIARRRCLGFSAALVFSSGPSLDFWRRCLPDAVVCDGLDLTALSHALGLQRARRDIRRDHGGGDEGGEGIDPDQHLLVVFDKCLETREWRHTAVRHVFLNGRHLRIHVVYIAAYRPAAHAAHHVHVPSRLVHLPKPMLAQIDIVFAFDVPHDSEQGRALSRGSSGQCVTDTISGPHTAPDETTAAPTRRILVHGLWRLCFGIVPSFEVFAAVFDKVLRTLPAGSLDGSFEAFQRAATLTVSQLCFRSTFVEGAAIVFDYSVVLDGCLVVDNRRRPGPGYLDYLSSYHCGSRDP